MARKIAGALTGADAAGSASRPEAAVSVAAMPLEARGPSDSADSDLDCTGDTSSAGDAVSLRSSDTRTTASASTSATSGEQKELSPVTLPFGALHFRPVPRLADGTLPLLHLLHDPRADPHRAWLLKTSICNLLPSAAAPPLEQWRRESMQRRTNGTLPLLLSLLCIARTLHQLALARIKGGWMSGFGFWDVAMTPGPRPATFGIDMDSGAPWVAALLEAAASAYSDPFSVLHANVQLPHQTSIDEKLSEGCPYAMLLHAARLAFFVLATTQTAASLVPVPPQPADGGDTNAAAASAGKQVSANGGGYLDCEDREIDPIFADGSDSESDAVASAAASSRHGAGVPGSGPAAGQDVLASSTLKYELPADAAGCCHLRYDAFCVVISSLEWTLSAPGRRLAREATQLALRDDPPGWLRSHRVALRAKLRSLTRDCALDHDNDEEGAGPVGRGAAPSVADRGSDSEDDDGFTASCAGDVRVGAGVPRITMWGLQAPVTPFPVSTIAEHADDDGADGLRDNMEETDGSESIDLADTASEQDDGLADAAAASSSGGGRQAATPATQCVLRSGRRRVMFVDGDGSLCNPELWLLHALTRPGGYDPGNIFESHASVPTAPLAAPAASAVSASAAASKRGSSGGAAARGRPSAGGGIFSASSRSTSPSILTPHSSRGPLADSLAQERLLVYPKHLCAPSAHSPANGSAGAADGGAGTDATALSLAAAAAVDRQQQKRWMRTLGLVCGRAVLLADWPSMAILMHVPARATELVAAAAAPIEALAWATPLHQRQCLAEVPLVQDAVQRSLDCLYSALHYSIPGAFSSASADDAAQALAAPLIRQFAGTLGVLCRSVIACSASSSVAPGSGAGTAGTAIAASTGSEAAAAQHALLRTLFAGLLLRGVVDAWKWQHAGLQLLLAVPGPTTGAPASAAAGAQLPLESAAAAASSASDRPCVFAMTKASVAAQLRAKLHAEPAAVATRLTTRSLPNRGAAKDSAGVGNISSRAPAMAADLPSVRTGISLSTTRPEGAVATGTTDSVLHASSASGKAPAGASDNGPLLPHVTLQLPPVIHPLRRVDLSGPRYATSDWYGPATAHQGFGFVTPQLVMHVQLKQVPGPPLLRSISSVRGGVMSVSGVTDASADKSAERGPGSPPQAQLLFDVITADAALTQASALTRPSPLLRRSSSAAEVDECPAGPSVAGAASSSDTSTPSLNSQKGREAVFEGGTGWRGAFAENSLWRVLFMLLYWGVVFVDEHTIAAALRLHDRGSTGTDSRVGAGGTLAAAPGVPDAASRFTLQAAYSQHKAGGHDSLAPAFRYLLSMTTQDLLALRQYVRWQWKTRWQDLPLDWDTSDFATARAAALEACNAQMRAMSSCQLAAEVVDAYARYSGAFLPGVRWDLWKLQPLAELVHAAGPAALLASLAPMAGECAVDRSGQPDVVLWRCLPCPYCDHAFRPLLLCHQVASGSDERLSARSEPSLDAAAAGCRKLAPDASIAAAAGAPASVSAASDCSVLLVDVRRPQASLAAFPGAAASAAAVGALDLSLLPAATAEKLSVADIHLSVGPLSLAVSTNPGSTSSNSSSSISDVAAVRRFHNPQFPQAGALFIREMYLPVWCAPECNSGLPAVPPHRARADVAPATSDGSGAAASAGSSNRAAGDPAAATCFSDHDGSRAGSIAIAFTPAALQVLRIHDRLKRGIAPPPAVAWAVAAPPAAAATAPSSSLSSSGGGGRNGGAALSATAASAASVGAGSSGSGDGGACTSGDVSFLGDPDADTSYNTVAAGIAGTNSCDTTAVSASSTADQTATHADTVTSLSGASMLQLSEAAAAGVARVVAPLPWNWPYERHNRCWLVLEVKASSDSGSDVLHEHQAELLRSLRAENVRAAVLYVKPLSKAKGAVVWAGGHASSGGAASAAGPVASGSGESATVVRVNGSAVDAAVRSEVAKMTARLRTRVGQA